jgi:putative flippase GtrA
LNNGTTIDNPGADADRAARSPDLVDFAGILRLPVAFRFTAIYSAPEPRCRRFQKGSAQRAGHANGTKMIPTPLQNFFDRLTVAWHERAVVLKAISFALVGVINTLIDFSVFWTTARILDWPLVPANVTAWLVAVSFSYAMNSFITFGPESGRILRWRDYATFAASGVAGMVASTATLFALSYAMPLLAAKLLSILVSFAVNFSLSHFVVFRARKPSGGAS